jgi:two-component system, sensor histidine kinase
MPVIDGYTATRIILEEAPLPRGIFRSLLLSLPMPLPVAQKRCLDAGMVDYLVKPLDFNKLRDVLANWLPNSRILSSPVRRIRPRPANREGEEGPVHAVINTAALARLREHVGDITPVVGVFLRSLERRLTELEKAISHGDTQAINKVAHTMKGSSSQFGAEELAHLCLLAENMGKNSNIQQIDRIYTQIVGPWSTSNNFSANNLINLQIFIQ